MSRVPRLLPLVGVAIGGVLAVRALADADALPRMLSGARAFAEDAAPKPAKGSARPKAGTSPAPAETATSAPAAAAAPQPLKVCAPSPAELARDAGLSPAELQVLQNLGARRTQLDARESDIDTQLKLLAAAETKLDTKLKGLNGLKADLQALLGQAESKESAEIDRLVIVYSKMKPRDAAAVMSQLEDKVRLPVAGKMKEAALAAILSQMAPADAKKLTESLAHRYDKVEQLAQAATAPPPPAATEPDPTAPPAKAAAPRPRRVRKPMARTAAAAATKAVAAAATAAPPKPAVTPASAPVPAAAAPAASKPAA